MTVREFKGFVPPRIKCILVPWTQVNDRIGLTIGLKHPTDQFVEVFIAECDGDGVWLL